MAYCLAPTPRYLNRSPVGHGHGIFVFGISDGIGFGVDCTTIIGLLLVELGVGILRVVVLLLVGGLAAALVVVLLSAINLPQTNFVESSDADEQI